MAYRDQTQGFGFVYVDIETLMARRDELLNRPETTPHLEGVKAINLNRDEQVTAPERPAVKLAPMAPNEREVAIRQIRENLDRLQTLHHKLHAMLDELNSATDSKKKK